MKIEKLNEDINNYLDEDAFHNFIYILFRFKETISSMEWHEKYGKLKREDVENYIKDFEKAANSLRKMVLGE